MWLPQVIDFDTCRVVIPGALFGTYMGVAALAGSLVLPCALPLCSREARTATPDLSTEGSFEPETMRNQ